MVGKGSANHNSRKFKAANVDGSRTQYNIGFIDRPIKEVYNRFRSKSVVFRVSPEEAVELNRAVAISGLPKQEYCYRRCMNREITVKGSPRVYIAMKHLHEEVLEELRRIGTGENVSPELLETIRLMTLTLKGLQEESTWKQKKR